MAHKGQCLVSACCGEYTGDKVWNPFNGKQQTWSSIFHHWVEILQEASLAPDSQNQYGLWLGEAPPRKKATSDI